MVDPDQISISELYKLVCGVESFYKAVPSAQCCSVGLALQRHELRRFEAHLKLIPAACLF